MIATILKFFAVLLSSCLNFSHYFDGPTKLFSVLIYLVKFLDILQGVGTVKYAIEWAIVHLKEKVEGIKSAKGFEYIGLSFREICM